MRFKYLSGASVLDFPRLRANLEAAEDKNAETSASFMPQLAFYCDTKMQLLHRIVAEPAAAVGRHRAQNCGKFY